MFNTIGGFHKNALGRGSASSWHKTKLEQSTYPDIYGFTTAYGTIYSVPINQNYSKINSLVKVDVYGNNSALLK